MDWTSVPVGHGIPADVPHAVSVSLPRWQDNIDYEEGRLADKMETGYPRFFIHRSIKKLAEHVEGRFAKPHEACLLVPTAKVADQCRAFMEPSCSDVRIVQLCLVPKGGELHTNDPCSAPNKVSVYIVLFPRERFPTAKAFWQHTGEGISSRMAEACLKILAESGKLVDGAGSVSSPPSPVEPIGGRLRNRHYSRSKSSAPEEESSVQDYVEERYGRNLPASSVALAKRALRRRIAGTLLANQEPQTDEAARETARKGTQLTEDDVYLYPTGMSAIYHAHQVAMSEQSARGAVGKSVCFGFPYTDTLKILQKWGPGCHHFGNGIDEEIDLLEQMLQTQTEPRLLALFCEFPSNPLLRSPDLARLRRLADEHDFLIVVDETIGNFVNVEVLPHADMVVSSLTKVFSGDTNVMGGSLVLNPGGRRVSTLRKALQADYEDTYWGPDAVFMERNSRDFIARIERVNQNAEALCEMLKRETERPMAERVVSKVQYPKYETRRHYDACRRKAPLLAEGSGGEGGGVGGYGGLFTIFFPSEHVASTFYDALACCKGPSLGTNFTLASPYAILAHYTELNWAAQFGVERTLVRVSVGLEQRTQLLEMFQRAIDAARAVL